MAYTNKLIADTVEYILETAFSNALDYKSQALVKSALTKTINNQIRSIPGLSKINIHPSEPDLKAFFDLLAHKAKTNPLFTFNATHHFCLFKDGRLTASHNGTISLIYKAQKADKQKSNLSADALLQEALNEFRDLTLDSTDEAYQDANEANEESEDIDYSNSDVTSDSYQTDEGSDIDDGDTDEEEDEYNVEDDNIHYDNQSNIDNQSNNTSNDSSNGYSCQQSLSDEIPHDSLYQQQKIQGRHNRTGEIISSALKSKHNAPQTHKYAKDQLTQTAEHIINEILIQPSSEQVRLRLQSAFTMVLRHIAKNNPSADKISFNLNSPIFNTFFILAKLYFQMEMPSERRSQYHYVLTPNGDIHATLHGKRTTVTKPNTAGIIKPRNPRGQLKGDMLAALNEFLHPDKPISDVDNETSYASDVDDVDDFLASFNGYFSDDDTDYCQASPQNATYLPMAEDNLNQQKLAQPKRGWLDNSDHFPALDKDNYSKRNLR